ncbi:hypothetical protein C3747_4g648 [Trypanosoma cruzi]|uniref:Uncharacterized protein n=1 Tax=Trypanosoma cruzi TaxID=5693 RepID=A0A2V2XJK6_TRYCR|nr:hypothetical protein C3747_4g648 [Trypanosoma cruzi]
MTMGKAFSDGKNAFFRAGASVSSCFPAAANASAAALTGLLLAVVPFHVFGALANGVLFVNAADAMNGFDATPVVGILDAAVVDFSRDVDKFGLKRNGAVTTCAALRDTAGDSRTNTRFFAHGQQSDRTDVFPSRCFPESSFVFLQTEQRQASICCVVPRPFFFF